MTSMLTCVPFTALDVDGCDEFFSRSGEDEVLSDGTPVAAYALLRVSLGMRNINIAATHFFGLAGLANSG